MSSGSAGSAASAPVAPDPKPSSAGGAVPESVKPGAPCAAPSSQPGAPAVAEASHPPSFTSVAAMASPAFSSFHSALPVGAPQLWSACLVCSLYETSQRPV